MEKQERYHEWIKKEFEKTRHELATDRQNLVEHDISLERERRNPQRHNQSSDEAI